jgi:tripartite-type tricarboxylate transporter receptor subunit TctC
MKRLVVLLTIFTLTASMVFGAGGSQSGGQAAPKYPTKAITLICPFAAGGGTDAILRAIAAALEKQLKVAVTVENRTGGGGTIGHAAIKNARPDGYTFGVITWELSEYKKQGVADFTYEDLDPLIRLNAEAGTLTVKSDAPYNNVKEWAEWTKAHPGEMTISGSGPLSVWHVAAALLSNNAGVETKWITSDGAAPAITQLVGGHLKAVTASLPEVKAQMEAGNVKCLGVMTAERNPAFPNVPTLKEQGYNVVFGTWRGIALPKGVDPEVREIILTALKAAAQDPDFIATTQRLNLNLAYQEPDDFKAFLKQDLEDVAKTIDDAHLLDQ